MRERNWIGAERLWRILAGAQSFMAAAQEEERRKKIAMMAGCVSQGVKKGIPTWLRTPQAGH